MSRCEGPNFKKWDDAKKLAYSMDIVNQISQFYSVLSKLVIVCLRRGLRLVVENPATKPHFLTEYFPIKPALVDKDRTLRGDWFKKPTQYWFINCEPEHTFIFEPLEHTDVYTVDKAQKMKTGKSRQENRSLMHPQYAERFIREFILDDELSLF